MHFSVSLSWDELEIFPAVIKFVSIDMMNFIFRRNGMKKESMHHKFYGCISLWVFFPLKSLYSFIIIWV